MARYLIDDVTVLDTNLCQRKWRKFFGFQCLYLTLRGDYYLYKNWEFEELTYSEAAAWLYRNGFKIPPDLKLYETEVIA